MANLDRFRGLLDNLGGIAWELDPATGSYASMAEAVLDLVGFPAERFLEEPGLWLDRVHPEDRSRVAEERAAIARDGAGTMEYRFVAKDDRVLWLLDVAHKVASDDAALLRGMSLEVTARKEAEERSQLEKETGLRMVAEHMPILLWTTDKRLRVTSAQGAALATFGVGSDEVKGLSLFEYFGADDPDFTPIAMHRRALKGEVLTYDRELKGRTFHFHVEPLRDVAGEVTGTVGAALDITDRKRAEEELRRNIELLRISDEARAQLLSHLVRAQEAERKAIAGGIHDDTIQIMGAVSLHLGLLRTRIDDGEGRETIAQLEDEVRQATQRLRQLLFELRPPSLDREGLIAALGTYLERMREDDGLDYTLVNNLSAEPGEEGRAILYRIAIEALANIRKHAGAALVNVAVEEADGGVLVRIADDGAGFVADGRAPEPGHLGLVGMRERAEMAGGRWRIESTVGAGTTVEFWIPEEIAVSLAAS